MESSCPRSALRLGVLALACTTAIGCLETSPELDVFDAQSWQRTKFNEDNAWWPRAVVHDGAISLSYITGPDVGDSEADEQNAFHVVRLDGDAWTSTVFAEGRDFESGLQRGLRPQLATLGDGSPALMYGTWQNSVTVNIDGQEQVVGKTGGERFEDERAMYLPNSVFAVDSQDRPWVAYVYEFKLRLASRDDDGQWSAITIDTQMDLAGLVIDSADEPHLFFWANEGRELNELWRARPAGEEERWGQSRIYTRRSGWGGFGDVAIRHAQTAGEVDRYAVVFADQQEERDAQAVYLLTGDASGSWNVSLLDEEIMVSAIDVSVEIAADGRAHVAYIDSDRGEGLVEEGWNSRLVYGQFLDGTWQYTNLERQSSTTRDDYVSFGSLDLALDGDSPVLVTGLSKDGANFPVLFEGSW